MRIPRLFACLLMVTLSACAREVIPVVLPEAPPEIRIPYWMAVGTTPIARVRLNDRISTKFLIDTGAPMCAIQPSLAEQLWETPEKAPPDRSASLEWECLEIPKVHLEVRSEAGIS